EQHLQDRAAEAGVVVAAGEIEGIELDLVRFDAEADAADDLVAGQDQAHARLVEVLAKDPPRTRGLVAEHALEMLAHHVDAQRQQSLEIFLPRRSEAPGRNHAAIIPRSWRPSAWP